MAEGPLYGTWAAFRQLEKSSKGFGKKTKIKTTVSSICTVLRLSVLTVNTYDNGYPMKRKLPYSVVRGKRVTIMKTTYGPFTTV